MFSIHSSIDEDMQVIILKYVCKLQYKHKLNLNDRSFFSLLKSICLVFTSTSNDLHFLSRVHLIIIIIIIIVIIIITQII